MRTLVFITSQFPYSAGEAFIEAEFPFLSREFDKIFIISQNISGKQTRALPENVTIYRYNTSTSLSGFLLLPFLSLFNFGIISKMVKDELIFRKSAGNPLTIKNRLILVKKIIKAIQLRDFIRGKLLDEKINGNIVFYSYWFKTGAHAIALLNYPDSIKVARAHGSDIYEEKTSQGYLPLLKFTAKNLDAIFFISENGRQYFSSKTKTISPSFIISRLGIAKPYTGEVKIPKSDKYVIVSCSNMIPLKRIDLIIASLELVVSDKKISWFHFGGGILSDDLEKLAVEKLGPLPNIEYSFMGQIPNDELLKFYSSNKIDLFINTSSTEGIPVSIMEAQSFGIPSIATDVGGVNEVVREGTGSLLPSDFKPSDLAKLIQQYAALPEEEQKILRNNALNNWESNFKASDNYYDFMLKLNSIFASSKKEIHQ
jgi:glycosyltransferase involved in cell wall biosynthesis